VVVDASRVYIPLHTAPQLVSRLLGLSSDFHESARRLFVGGSAIHFSAEMKKGEPSTLVLSFSAPVNPAISTEPGRLRLVFQRDPVVSTSENFKFDDPVISGATYSESAGGSELDITGKAPLLATFSEAGKTITVTIAPGTAQASPAAQTPAVPSQPGAEVPLGNLAPGPPQQPAPLVPGTPTTRYLVVIDPAHGGDDPGAKFSEKLQEKDITLAFARRLRSALAERGVSARLLRDGDPTIGTEQRAASANNLHATIYVAVHAGTPGSGVRLYSSMLTEADKTPAAFYPWQTAQSYFLRPSRIVAQAAIEELGKRKVGVLLMPSNLRPLNNVAAAVLGVELAAPSGDPERMTGGRYQDPIAAAVAQGIANARNLLEAPE
jgi:N-acetylmuramoyl-L-alanine amidase